MGTVLSIIIRGLSLDIISVKHFSEVCYSNNIVEKKLWNILKWNVLWIRGGRYISIRYIDIPNLNVAVTSVLRRALS